MIAQVEMSTRVEGGSRGYFTGKVGRSGLRAFCEVPSPERIDSRGGDGRHTPPVRVVRCGGAVAMRYQLVTAAFAQQVVLGQGRSPGDGELCGPCSGQWGGTRGACQERDRGYRRRAWYGSGRKWRGARVEVIEHSFTQRASDFH